MEELRLFLKQHSHLQTLQDRLEREMDSVHDEYRLMVLAKHITWNLEELAIELTLLQAILDRASA